MPYQLYYANGESIDESAAMIVSTNLSKTIHGLANETGYAFVVSAVNGAIESILSEVSTATPQAIPTVPPPPTNVTVTPTVADGGK